MLDGICLSCFKQRGQYQVCPHCGHIDGTPPKEAYLLTPGTILAGRFVVGTVLGMGGFGATYKAWDAKLAVVVAIKEFYPGGLVSRIPGESQVRLFSGEKEAAFNRQLERFLDEARNMARFTGEKHIVNVFDFFQENHTAYIVMEFLDGFTLKAYMAEQGGRLLVEQCLEIMDGVLEAVGTIHKKSIIHRDISPDNIFILKDNQVKVLDFGAARFAVNEQVDATQSVVIKMGYAPPEQYRTNMKQGVWTDIYALGATLYKMITGVTPEESIDRMEQDNLKRPRQLGVKLDEHVEKAIMKAMALRPELRFKSVEQMWSALHEKARVDYPEEELKKRKRLRVVTVLLTLTLILGMGTYAGYQSTRPQKETLADMEIDSESITLSILEDQEQLATYEQLAKAFMENYPQYQVTVQVGDDGDVFLCGAENQDRKKADLTLLLDSLLVSEFWFLSYYDSYYQQPDKIPTSFDFMTVFANEISATDQGVELPTKPLTKEQLSQLTEQLGEEDLYVDQASSLRWVQSNWPGYYKVLPFLDYEPGDIWFTGEFAIDAQCSESKQQVGMLFLHFMLSEYAQNYSHVQQDGYVPLNKKAFAQYVDINKDYEFLTSQIKSMEKGQEDRR